MYSDIGLVILFCKCMVGNNSAFSVCFWRLRMHENAHGVISRRQYILYACHFVEDVWHVAKMESKRKLNTVYRLVFS